MSHSKKMGFGNTGKSLLITSTFYKVTLLFQGAATANKFKKQLRLLYLRFNIYAGTFSRRHFIK